MSLKYHLEIMQVVDRKNIHNWPFPVQTTLAWLDVNVVICQLTVKDRKCLSKTQ